MATSSFGHIRNAVSYLLKLNPQSVLDIGVGFGRWGFICRELLDATFERVDKSRWKIRIEGIEAYEPYIQDHQRYLYDTIHIGNASGLIHKMNRFDTVIIGDMLEHLSKDDAWDLFHSAIKQADKGLILNIPIGEEWLRETGHENIFEDHLSWWSLEEFTPYYPETHISQFDNGSKHASMLFLKNRYEGRLLIEDANAINKNSDIDGAIKKFSSAIDKMQDMAEPYMLLFSLFFDNGQNFEAEATLLRMTKACPRYYEGKLTLAKLQQVIGKKEEAISHAREVADGSDATEEIKAQANALIAKFTD